MLFSCSVSSSMGCSPSGKICSSMGYPWITIPSGNIQLLWQGALHGLQCGYPLRCGPLHMLQGNICSGSCSSSSPSPSLTLIFPLLFLTVFPHSSAFLMFLPFFKYAFTEVPPAWLMCSSGSIGAGSAHNRGSHWFLLTEATPCHVKPIQEHLLRPLTPEIKPKQLGIMA